MSAIAAGAHAGAVGAVASSVRVSRLVAIRYALPAAPLGFMVSIAGMYLLKFASDVLLIAPALFSTLFAASKVVDALSDPVVGYASDRTRVALGRRRPWILAGIVPIVVTFWAVWSPPTGLTATATDWWVGCSVVLYYLAYSLAAVPHLALGAELSPHYHDRTRIFSARAACELAGMSIAAGAMWWLQTSSDTRAAGQAIAIVFCAATTLLLAWSALGTHERADFQQRTAPSPRRAIADVARNPHARILVFAVAADTLSFSLLGALFPFIAAYALPGEAVSAGYVGAAIALAVLLFPVWSLLARRFGKRASWMTALGMRIVGFSTLLVALPNVPALLPLSFFLIGGSLACTFIIAPSIKSDVIDYDDFMTGDRKEGSYFAVWNLLQKLAAGLAIAIAGVALGAVGYEANAEQSPETIRAMLVLFSGVPLVLHAAAFVLVWHLGLDEREHERIRLELARRSLDST